MGVAKKGLVLRSSGQIQYLHPTRNEKEEGHRIFGSAENEHGEQDEITGKRQMAVIWSQKGHTTCKQEIFGTRIIRMGEDQGSVKSENKPHSHI